MTQQQTHHQHTNCSTEFKNIVHIIKIKLSFLCFETVFLNHYPKVDVENLSSIFRIISNKLILNKRCFKKMLKVIYVLFVCKIIFLVKYLTKLQNFVLQEICMYSTEKYFAENYFMREVNSARLYK